MSSEAVRKVQEAFPHARVREVYLLLIQQCANHPRSVFVQTTENRLVLKHGRFLMASRDDVLLAVAAYDAFLCYLVQTLTFRAAQTLPSETAIESATGFGGTMQVILIEELVSAGVLAMDDVPGALPRYSLRPDFNWDGRYLLFGRSASVWMARKPSSPDGRAMDMAERDVGGEDEFGSDAPSAFEQAWSEISTSRAKPSSRPPSLDEALSRLTSALFKGASFNAPDGDKLNALVSSALQIPMGMAASILAPSGLVPRVVRRIDDGLLGCRVEIDPGLTWNALAAYPITQQVCERFLELR